ncbi:MAG: hypothetical protein JWL81_2853 [Verrucomicrobiales bacterium]|nr:hypothetical protein [Verrucomicrobiales bacterium]
MSDKPPVTNLKSPEERRTCREERRQQQRDANPARAQKMHTARLDYQNLLTEQPAPPPTVNVGCSGWFYWHWRGVFYPEQMPTKEWFPTYRKSFSTVELNAPFYSWPTINAVKGWMRQVGNEPFIYTVKVNELITHAKHFIGTKTLVRDFQHIADLLGPRMGCFLFQLPPSYDYSPARLKAIISQMDPARRNVVEFRHESWWNENVYEAFREHGIIFCSCSAPRLPDKLVLTSPEIYIRFHGKAGWYRHHYTDSELSEWLARVRGSGAERVWAYFNNDFEGHAIDNARNFQKMLETPHKTTSEKQYEPS